MNNISHDEFETAIISIAGPGPLSDIISKTSQCYYLNQRLSPLSYFSLLKAAKSFKPDILISTMTHMNFSTLALKPFFPKAKFIVREAITPSFFLQKYAKYTWLLKFLYRSLYPLADKVLSPTQLVFDEFKRDINLHLKNNHVLKNPVRINQIRNQISLEQPSDDRLNKVHFVACGRLGVQKGFDRLIENLPTLNLPYDWQLDIVGKGNQRATLEQLIKQHNLQEKVFLRGLVFPPYNYMAKADCFLMPSRFEGLPNAVLESLACGTPIIATAQSGGIQEIADHNKENAVTIVDSMDDFIAQMNLVVPQPMTEIKPCLISDRYNLPAIIDEFTGILRTL